MRVDDRHATDITIAHEGTAACQASNRAPPFWPSAFGLLILPLLLTTASAQAPSDEEVASEPVLITTSPISTFEQLWQITRDQIYPLPTVTTHLETSTYQHMRERASSLHSINELPDFFNPFLNALGVSHTQLYSRWDLEHAFLRSLFSTRDLTTPPFSHPGLQLVEKAGRWWIREVWDGLPGDQAGLRRGDALLTIDGSSFTPQQLCEGGTRRSGEAHTIEVQRGSKLMTIALPCARQNPHASMYDAMVNSVRTLSSGNHKIGYVHLWTGTSPEILSRFQSIISGFTETDALILDLRGGFGGAWYEHLDPFFVNRDGFYSFTVTNREGCTVYEADAHETTSPYLRPMVVLINEGTRSGKEAVAYQFKKSSRAKLIGSRTKGAFTAGRGFFVDGSSPLVFFLSVAEYRLDGQRIEGVGVAPDFVVPFPAKASVTNTAHSAPETATARQNKNNRKRSTGKHADPQLAAALAHLSAVLNARTTKARPT